MSPRPTDPEILAAARDALVSAEKFKDDARVRLVEAVKFKTGARARLRNMRAATFRAARPRDAGG
jgi:phosphotransacetylase